MIYHIKGDLLKSDCDVIAHQSNCRLGFGSGIAGQIRQYYSGAFNAFITDHRTPQEKLGTFSCSSNQVGSFGIIYNLYGQDYFGTDKQQTDYKALESALRLMLDDIACNLSELKIGLPYLIGCGLAGGDWKIVYEIIERVFNEFNVDCYLYEFTP